MHDDYKQLDAPAGAQIERCPVCGSAPQVWQYSVSPTAPTSKLVMCSQGDKIGPQDGIKNEGCLLYMPPDYFYRETIRDAIRFWNEFARALVALRTSGETLPAPRRWIERWHGSGPDRGWWVWEDGHGNPVAYVGEGDQSERLTSILVEKHNAALGLKGPDLG